MKSRPEDPATAPPIYRIRNLSVTFTKQSGIVRKERSVIRAVDGLSLDIYEREILSLVGESGSGKTTVARCLMGLNPITSGSIKFRGGVDVTKLRGVHLLDYWREVQMIFQDPFESLYPRFDVYTIVATPMAQLAGESSRSQLQEKVAKLLVEVGLDPGDTMYKLPHQLSGGERQRVSIARALAPNPQILIADEPITMLDASLRLNILSLLSEIKERRGLTIVMITHDLASAKIMSDRTAVMYLGKLVELGPTENVLSSPHHPYTELILKSTPRFPIKQESKGGTEVKIVARTIEDPEAIIKGCKFTPRCAYRTSICSQVEPPLSEKSVGHSAACHHPLNVGE
jgi:peptide/nickel transport system ATP-binding protein